MMCEGILKIVETSEPSFDPEFCKEAIIFLEREIKILEGQRSQAQEVFNELFAGRLTNPIKVMTINDVENFIDRITAKIEAAEMSICELNIRKYDYETEKYSLHEMPDDVLLNDKSMLLDPASFIMSTYLPTSNIYSKLKMLDNYYVNDTDVFGEQLARKFYKGKAVGSEKIDKTIFFNPHGRRKNSHTGFDSGYSSSACCSPDLQTPCTNPIIGLLGGELPYFSIDDNVLPKSLFGTFSKPALSSNSKKLFHEQ